MYIKQFQLIAIHGTIFCSESGHSTKESLILTHIYAGGNIDFNLGCTYNTSFTHFLINFFINNSNQQKLKQNYKGNKFPI